MVTSASHVRVGLSFDHTHPVAPRPVLNHNNSRPVNVLISFDKRHARSPSPRGTDHTASFDRICNMPSGLETHIYPDPHPAALTPPSIGPTCRSHAGQAPIGTGSDINRRLGGRAMESMHEGWRDHGWTDVSPADLDSDARRGILVAPGTAPALMAPFCASRHRIRGPASSQPPVVFLPPLCTTRSSHQDWSEAGLGKFPSSSHESTVEIESEREKARGEYTAWSATAADLEARKGRVTSLASTCDQHRSEGTGSMRLDPNSDTGFVQRQHAPLDCGPQAASTPQAQASVLSPASSLGGCILANGRAMVPRACPFNVRARWCSMCWGALAQFSLCVALGSHPLSSPCSVPCPMGGP
jgi:hypothetical protein